jgi:hypothetical protein
MQGSTVSVRFRDIWTLHRWKMVGFLPTPLPPLQKKVDDESNKQQARSATNPRRDFHSG